MNIFENAAVHNKFDFLVVDANTGEEKQRAVAYNMILNYWFQGALSIDGKTSNGEYDSNPNALISRIAFGTGTGTLSPTRTSLFTQLGWKVASDVATVYAYPTSYRQKRIKLEANEYVGARITEVGFMRHDDYWTYPYVYLTTHAMLQDSEGNQIAITKTDTDVVYITATFYVTHTPSGFGANGIYPPAEKNYLIRYLLTGTFDNTVAFGRFPLANSNDLSTASGEMKKSTSRKTWSYTISGGDTTNLRINMPVITFLETEANNRIVKHIGTPFIGAVTFPNHDIFPPYLIEKIPIGTGDGETTEFNIQCPLIMENSDTVYVDNVAQVRGTDYTIDYESNCGDWYENYLTAQYSVRSPEVTFGNIASKTPYGTGRTYRDPVAWWDCSDTSFYPSSVTVSAATPILINFGSPKACNTLKINGITVPAAQIDNLVIEYSENGTEWTPAPDKVRDGQVWRWTETSAQYWRVYIPSYNWTYDFLYTSIPTRDGLAYGSTFFLGKQTLGLKFTNPPATGAAIAATYSIEYPFKTANNLLRFTYTIQLQRG